MERNPVFMDNDCFDLLIKKIKSLFYTNNERYINKDGNLENSICFDIMFGDIPLMEDYFNISFDDIDYDIKINNFIENKLDGLDVEKYEHMKTWFNYQDECVLMMQHLNDRCDEITFVFTKLNCTEHWFDIGYLRKKDKNIFVFYKFVFIK